MAAGSITTERLELVILGPAFLDSWLARRETPELGFRDPEGFLAAAEDLVRLRFDELTAAPQIAPWLVRAIVLRAKRIAIGTIGFHAAPDARGMVELGYEIVPTFRGRGYALEAAAGIVRWAADSGAQIIRASVSPDNLASLAVIARLGLAHVGEQLDAEDGRELVFEKSVT
jgi:RimJ/RimL family protein N-acetyltransferase